MGPLTLLVVARPNSAHLRLLERLPDSTTIVAGECVEAFAARVAEADVILNSMAPREVFRQVWLKARRVQWVHSLSAGVDNMLFPELVASPQPLTNSRGVFSRSLAEFVMSGVLHFAKDLRRMVRSQQQGQWDQFDIEEIHGRSLGIVGYGDIGRAVAAPARAFGMRVLALRRRPELCDDDALVDQAFPPAELHRMLAASDYVVAAAPLTAATRGLIGEAALRAMKQTAVLINIGRGPVVVEADLVRALREGWIRGAALDVFDVEPLPAGHPFYGLENLLLSPHCADHFPGWAELAMERFLENFERFRNGEPLLHLVDKQEGY